MSDLKEEAAVDNTERTVRETVARRKQGEPGLEGIQLFYEKNKKAVNYVGGGLLVLIAAILYWKLSYIPGKEKEAANEMYWAEDYFEKDSFNLALKGGIMVYSPDGQKQMMGFEQVAEEYGSTRVGNLANFYAGICYLRTGKFEQAIESLKKYDNNDMVIAPIALGATGDCYMEMKQFDEAQKYYQKAADKVNNSFTAPFYLQKLALACELTGDYARAVESYERIQKEYPASAEGREAVKYISRARAMGNL